MAVLALAWWSFLRQRRGPEAVGARPKTLTFASVIVGLFVAQSLYASLAADAASSLSGPGELITMPVHGISCSAVEQSTESALRDVDGVLAADVSAAEGTVTLRVEPGTVSLETLVAGLRQAGLEPDVAAATRRH